jgi:hypothetical protein
MAVPIFSSVVYLSPWLPLPQGWVKVGLNIVVTTGASGQVLAARLRQGSTVVQTGLGATATEALLLPDAPLSALLDYAVDVQWVASGTDPGTIQWTAGSYATAPVLTAVATVTEATVGGTSVSLGWTFGSAALVPAGANVSAYTTGGISAGFNRVQGITGTMPLNSNAAPGTQLYVQAVMPIDGAPGAGFAAPFTAGPIVAGLPLPLEAPSITTARFDGTQIAVDWTPPTVPDTGGSAGYELAVTATSATSRFTAGSTGGLAPVGSEAGAALAVAGAVRNGVIAGAPGAAVDLLTVVPTLDRIAVNADHVDARITFPAGSPAGATADAKLMLNGVETGSSTTAASGATVSISGFSATPTDGWTVQAALAATVSGVALSGPSCRPVAVLAAAPTVAQVTIVPDADDPSHWSVTVTAGSTPPPETTLSVAITQGGTAVASQAVTGSATAHFTLAQGDAAVNTIDGAAMATVTLTLSSAQATSPSASASFVGAVPTISAVQNIGADDPSGQAQGVQIDVASAETGKTLVVRLMAQGKIVMTGSGPESSAHVNLPLDQPLDPSLAWTLQARWTGDGIDAASFGGWSAPVAVLTATTSVLSAAFDAGTLSLAIQPPQGTSAAQGAYIFASDSGGQKPITGANVIGTQARFALPSGNAVWQAGAKPFQPLPASSNSRTLAPSSALLPILTAAPTFSRLAYDGAVLSAAWSVVSDSAGNPATGAVLKIADATGSIVTAPSGSSSGEIAVQIPASAQGTTTVAVRATCDSAGLHASGAYSAALAPLVAAPTLGTVTLNTDEGTVDADVTAPEGVPAGTAYRAWLMAGDHVLGAPVTGTDSLSFSYAALGVPGLSIVAQAEITAGGVAMTGPRTAPVPVLSVAPQLTLVTVASTTPAGHLQLTATWVPPTDDRAITHYSLRLDPPTGDKVFEIDTGTATSGVASFAATDVSATAANRLSLWASAQNGSKTPVCEIPIWCAVPHFTALTTDLTGISAQWTAPAGPQGASYRLGLVDVASAEVLAEVTTSALGGGIDISALNLDPAGSYTLVLAVVSGVTVFDTPSDTTAKTRPVPLFARPDGVQVTTDAASAKAKVSWTAVSGASGYTLSFAGGALPDVTTTDTYHVLSDPLSPGEIVRVTITANIVTDGVTSTGPASDPLVIPTAAPALVAADFNGSQVSASWQPLADAVGYLATVLDKDGNIAASAPQVASTSVAFTAALPSSAAPYRLVVQSVNRQGSGLPSDPLDVFSTAWFVSTQAPAAAPPNIFPAAKQALAAEQITIYLPALADQAITVAPVGPFTLAANPDAGSAAAYPYTLSFAADSDVWSFSDGGNPLPPIRPDLKTNYVNFLKAAETAGASPWGLSVMQLAISRWMPQTFEESHYYAYGLDLGGGPGTGSIDLRQGLVLRVNFADYTNVWSGEADSWLNGFGGGSPNDFDVGDTLSGSGAWQLAMDAFISRLTASGAMTVAPPSTVVPAASASGVTDAADLFFPGFPNPYYRLFFPGTLLDPTSTGSVSTSANFALASAATYSALASASATPGATTPVVYFRGRAVLRVMIRVRLNEMEVTVPLGTTVGNLLDRYGIRPPASPVQLAGLTIDRGAGPGHAVFGATPTPPKLVYDSARRCKVRLDWETMATYGGPVDATNLPLLHGDRITF